MLDSCVFLEGVLEDLRDVEEDRHFLSVLEEDFYLVIKAPILLKEFLLRHDPLDSFLAEHFGNQNVFPENRLRDVLSPNTIASSMVDPSLPAIDELAYFPPWPLDVSPVPTSHHLYQKHPQRRQHLQQSPFYLRRRLDHPEGQFKDKKCDQVDPASHLG